MKVNISIDDVTPHPFSSTNVLEKCEELLETFPEMKFSLFVPVAYWRTMKSGTTTNKPMLISEYPEFCETLMDLPEENYEIGYHGYYHGILNKSDNDEFQYLDYDTTMSKIDLMFQEVEKAGLSKKFKKIFRPPAWRLSPDAFRALSDRGFELFALTDLPHIKEVYAGEENNHPCTFSNQFPPFKPLKETEKCGIVYHACEWDKNYLNVEKRDELIKFLSDKECEFVFLDGLL
jgi:peptidoglycan/xylan/chitin deacetylase (PgdA/CDA1 family)